MSTPYLSLSFHSCPLNYDDDCVYDDVNDHSSNIINYCFNNYDDENNNHVGCNGILCESLET